MRQKMEFEDRAAAPGHQRCPSCQQMVALPPTDPWLIDGGTAYRPTLLSFRCPACRGEIHVHAGAAH